MVSGPLKLRVMTRAEGKPAGYDSAGSRGGILPPRPDVAPRRPVPLILRCEAVEAVRAVKAPRGVLKSPRPPGRDLPHPPVRFRFLVHAHAVKFNSPGPPADTAWQSLAEVRDEGHHAVVDEDAVREVLRLPGYRQVPDRPLAGGATSDHTHGSKLQVLPVRAAA